MSLQRYECEVVIVGTGAGGAAAAAILAERGHDVIILEEGRHIKKEEHGNVFKGFIDMYFNAASTVTFGKPPISITLGSVVGGTTAINSSTCFRPPKKKVEAWGGPAWDELLPHMEDVERRINAHHVEPELLGGNWKALKRGCDKLGVGIRPLSHNVKNCVGRGMCQFGCPEGAKQSADISYIPGAIQHGARLLAEHRVESLIVKGGSVAGVRGRCAEGGFEVIAKKTVLAMGAMRTPVFLLKNKIANSSRRVGKGLQIHPASRVVAEFDEIIEGHRGLPQGAFIDKWADRGVMLEGIFLPPGLLFSMMNVSGEEFKSLVARYRNLSAFGVMVSDTSTGSVRPGHLGAPFMALYSMNRKDAESMHFGVARLCEIYLAAGAKKIHTGFYPVPFVKTESDLKQLESAKPRATDFEIGAFHPLGTCAMGADPRRSVVDFSLRSHDSENLYIMDGSVVPGSLGVNPQVTIMTLATRAAHLLASEIQLCASPKIAD